MRKSIFFLFSLLLVSFVCAADIDFSIDGKPLSSTYELVPGQKISFDFIIAPGVLVRDIKVKADKHYYETLFDNSLSQRFTRSDKQSTSSTYVNVPSQVPSGDSNVEVTVFYEDADFNKKQSQYSTLLKVKDGSGVLGFLTAVAPDRVADELLGAYGAIDIPRLDPKLTIDDLNKRDFEKLGLSFQDLAEGKFPKITETVSKVSRMNLDQNKEQFQKFGMKGSLQPEVELKKTAFEVRFGDNSIMKSKIILSVPAKESISLVDTVIIIPKSVAESADALEFSETPIILENDPVIKWNIANIPEGQTKDYAVVSDGDAVDADIAAAASGKSMSWLTKLILWILGK